MEGRNRAENLLKKVFGVEVGLGLFKNTLTFRDEKVREKKRAGRLELRPGR